jgi:hypothetical protein
MMLFLNSINDDVKMGRQLAVGHPVKTGYFQKVKKSWKKGRTKGLH